MPEPRTAVMIVVEASWKNQDGTAQKAHARMENKSLSGACIRMKKPLRVGTRVKVRWRWEEFTGITKYCRSETDGYRVGLQKEVSKNEGMEETRAEEVSVRGNVSGRDDLMRAEGITEEGNPTITVELTEKIVADESADDSPEEVKATEESIDASALKVDETRAAAVTAEMEVASVVQQRPASQIVENLQAQGFGAMEETRLQEDRRPIGREAGKERKFMQSKWLNWRKKEEAPNANGNGNGTGADARVGTKEEKNGKHRLETDARTERKTTMAAAENGIGLKSELLAMEDIYRAAGIMTPRRGYSINKVVEMLYSDHIRGLSKEMRRASVLMALDAAGVSIDEVLRDARVRQEAIDSYEAEQRKQLEAHWAQKAEENAGIEAEMERVKASYLERIKRNQDGMAREKATFLSWVTTKQQEAQNMKEAAELCLKPAVKPAPIVETEVADKEESVAELMSGAGTKVKVV
jgi:hypothetical protein